MTKPAQPTVCWAYMVRCKYGTYYCGWTNDLGKRITAHNEGTGAKYLRGKGPVALVYKKKFLSVADAQAHERMLKKLTRENKMRLIAS